MRGSCGILLAIILSACQLTGGKAGETWKVYRNPRYQFELPYPGDWQPAPPPDNRDGQSWHDPDNSSVEIRAWATPVITPIKSSSATTAAKKASTTKQIASASTPRAPQSNFKTQQGLLGHLQVDIGLETSSLTLTLTRNNLVFRLQGRSPSQNFVDYYPLFYQVAQQYRIPEMGTKP